MTRVVGELVQVDPDGPTLRFQWNPTHLRRGGREARLSSIDRPRRLSATEWEGRTPFEISFELRLDGYPDTPVTDDQLTLERMAGWHTTDQEPPKLRLRYAGYARRLYVIEQLAWGPELRREDLSIVRIDADVKLREWITPDLTVAPARKAQQKAAADGASQTSGRTHTVASGDTLWALATSYLGDGNRWQEIADANGVRDPRTLQIGTRLRIPDR